MPERPVVLFNQPALAKKSKRQGGPSSISVPSHSRQVERIAPKMAQLQKVIDQNRLAIQSSSSGIEPEKTLVFVVKGDLDSFYIAVRNMNKSGECMELVFDTSDDDVPVTDDFFVVDKKGQKKDVSSFRAKVYCVLTNTRALEELMSLWTQYAKDPSMKFPLGKTGLRDVFDNLVDMHFWGPKERIEETGILEAWQEDLQLEPELSVVKCEIELFYRKSQRLQKAREDDTVAYINSIGGKVLKHSVIDGIAYHALLVSIPRQVAEDLISQKDIEIVNVEQIMFFRPVGQSVVIPDESLTDSPLSVEMPNDVMDEPVVALFDGMPQENHPYLRGLLTVDDPDGYTKDYAVRFRKHGTSMASLIAHGDLLDTSHQTTRKLYVRPIMKPNSMGQDYAEAIPQDILLVDKIHEAVRRLFVPEAGEVAPNIRVINFSIGISNQVFYSQMSPLARLLDWLSYEFGVLFVVSAGNHSNGIKLSNPFDQFKKLSMNQRDANAVHYLNENARHLRLLAPAESINALTVGATFKDNSTVIDDPRQLLFCSDGMPSPYSALGRGLNNSVKPDVIFTGGRNTMFQDMRDMDERTTRWRAATSRAPGVLSAAPNDIASDTTKALFSFGTSNSAALLTHQACRCHEVLLGVFHEVNKEVPYDRMALLIKAMLIHGAEWGRLDPVFCQALGFKNRKDSSDYLHKFLGYGVPNIERAIECAKNRITLIGYGDLKDGEAHLFDLPLPFDFNREKVLRRLTPTLTYFAPIVPTRQKYRSAQVWYTIEGGKKKFLDNRLDAHWQAAVRGTVQHEIFENDDIVVWDEDDTIQLKVNCRGDADEAFEGSIPYALFVSFEIKSGVEVDVYERVLAKIKPRVSV